MEKCSNGLIPTSSQSLVKNEMAHTVLWLRRPCCVRCFNRLLWFSSRHSSIYSMVHAKDRITGGVYIRLSEGNVSRVWVFFVDFVAGKGCNIKAQSLCVIVPIQRCSQLLAVDSIAFKVKDNGAACSVTPTARWAVGLFQDRVGE